MAVCKTAYNTTAHMGDKLQTITSQLSKALITNSIPVRSLTLSNTDQTVKIGLVQGGNVVCDSIPYFNHPIFIQDPTKTSEDPIVVIDVRNFGMYNRPQAKFVVRNKTEYLWNIQRAVLNYIWAYARKESLRDLSLLPAAAYSSLMAESVGRRYALDMAEQTTLQVLACYYYYCQFTDNKEWDEVEYNRIVGAIARCTKVQADFIYKTLHEAPIVNTLSEFCQIVKTRTQSVSLEGFDVGILLSITGGSWFGTNARDVMAVAIEHPPTWVMVVYGGVTEATYKRSVLAKLMERLAKKHPADVFAKNLITLLNTDVALESFFTDDQPIDL